MASEASRRLHPLTLIFATVGIARSMLFPAIAGGFGVGGRFDRALPIFLLVLAVPAVIGAAVKYHRYRWRLTADELILDSGLLLRRNRVIPFARVQNVEVRQGALQRVFGVAELRVETAGSGVEAEALLSVLALDDARRARAELLAGRHGAAADRGAPAGAAEGDTPAGTELARLSTGDLLLAGATANEAGVIAAALAGLLQFADGLPLGVLESAVDRVILHTGGAVVLAVVGIVLLFLAAGWIISIVGAVVHYHDFTLWRVGDALGKRYGLLTVREASVPLERVQAVRVEEPILRRGIGCASLQIETAGGAPGQRGGAEAFVPIAPNARIPGLVRGVFEEVDLASVELQRVHPRAQRRLARRGILWLLLAAAPFLVARWLEIEPAAGFAPWLVLLVPLPFLFARWQYRNRGWALGDGFLVARAGVMNRVTWIVPDRKLQTLHIRSTPFQRRLGLATLVVDTAAGGRQAAIVDLAEPVARELVARLRERMEAVARTAVTGLRPRLPEGAPEGLVEAGDENLVVGTTWIHEHTDGMTAELDGGVALADSGLHSAALNTVVRARLYARAAPGRIAEIAERFRAADSPFTWRVGPEDRPPTLDRLLRGAGMRRAGDETALWADLDRIVVPDLAPHGLRIVRVRDAARLAEFAGIVAADREPADPEIARFLAAAAAALLAEGAPIRLYLGLLGSLPVATAALVTGGGVVGVYSVCTLAAYRGRGLGTALAAQPLLDAREEGVRTAVLLAPAERTSIGERLGFTAYGRYTSYRSPEGR
jgi:putative membrane protein